VLQTFRFLKMHNSVQSRISVVRFNFQKSQLSDHRSYRGVQITVGKIRKCSTTLVLAPGQVSLRAVPSLHLLTIARSQVRIIIGTNIFVCSLVGRLSMPTCHGFHQHVGSSVYICGCSISKVALIRHTNSKFPFSFNSYAVFYPLHANCVVLLRVSFSMLP
jgi:hypothetical protein